MKRILFLSAATLGLTLLMSCSKSSDPVVAASTCQLAADRSDAVSKAAAAYGANPTNSALCKAYVDAANAFLDAAKTCTTISAAQIQSTRDGINSTKC